MPPGKYWQRYRVQSALHGAKPHEVAETNDVDDAIDELFRLLDNEPDDALITFICRPFNVKRAKRTQ